MRVALFTDTYVPAVNGVAKTLGRWVEYLEANNVPVKVFAPSAEPGGAEEGSGGVERVFGIPFFLYPECRMALPNPAYLRKALHDFRPDLIHVATPLNLGLYGNLYARKHGIPLVASYHTNFDQYAASYKLSWMVPMLDRYMAWFHEECRKVYVPSRSTKEHLRRLGIPNVELWGRGIRSDQFHPGVDRARVLTAHEVDPRKFVVLYVGRLAPEKSLDVLMGAFAAVPEPLQRKMQLIIAGDGPLYKELAATAELHDNVKLSGFVHGERLRELYASADVFMFPSATETFGNVVLEALACGTPVIGAAAGGVGDNLVHGRTGLLCEAGNVRAFTNALVRIYQDAGLRARLSSAGRQHAHSQSWERIFAELLTSYRAVSGEAMEEESQAALIG